MLTGKDREGPETRDGAEQEELGHHSTYGWAGGPRGATAEGPTVTRHIISQRLGGGGAVWAAGYLQSTR